GKPRVENNAADQQSDLVVAAKCNNFDLRFAGISNWLVSFHPCAESTPGLFASLGFAVRRKFSQVLGGQKWEGGAEGCWHIFLIGYLPDREPISIIAPKFGDTH